MGQIHVVFNLPPPVLKARYPSGSTFCRDALASGNRDRVFILITIVHQLHPPILHMVWHNIMVSAQVVKNQSIHGHLVQCSPHKSNLEIHDKYLN